MPSTCSRSVFLFALPAAAVALFTGAAWGATFGTVVPIGGHAADIALDEARGVVYVANYTANRIDVVSIKNRAVQNSINVGRQPASLALSPDGRWLLVAHYADSKAGTSNNALTVLDMSGNANMKQTFAFGAPPVGVAFGNDGLALVVTLTDFVLFDPTNGYAKSIDTIAGASAKALPVPVPTFPREIISASVATSGDGTCIWGTVQGTGSNIELMFRYDVQSKQIGKFGWIASPPPGPRVMSTNTNGSVFLAAWGLYHENDFLLAQFPEAWGDFVIGTHVIDSARGLIYAQMPKAKPKTVPVTSCTTLEGVQICVTKDTTVMQPVDSEMKILQILDADNLTVREKLLLPENLTGKSILSSKGDVMYAGSDSGVMFLPVGLLNQQHRVAATQEDVVFRGSWCDRKVLTQEINIVDPGNPAVGRTDFQVVSVETGDVIAAGMTPARVRIPLDMNRFLNSQGTSELHFALRSAQGVNVPLRTDGANGKAWSFRVLVNNREPDQRGTFFSVPGKLVDLLADPVRNRFYVLRQDQNQVLVFDASNNRQIATLRTGNTPWSMAMTFDRQFLIIGADNSQVAHVYNLDTLNFDRFIVFPSGHYPRSIAASASAILAACRVAGAKHTIDRIQMWGIATELPTLGIYENDINVDTALAVSPTGSSILAAMPDGRVMLYDANADTFSAARKDLDKLGGAYAALPGDRYLIDNHLFNSSLVNVFDFAKGTGNASGFAMADQFGLRTTAPSSFSPGVVQRIDFTSAGGADFIPPVIVRPTRMTEAPLLPSPTTGSAFTRSLAPLANRQAIVSLSTSGITVLPWNYDAAVADPRIEAVASAADGSKAVAPGALVSIYGKDLSPVTAATGELPLPTALGDSCLTVNGALVPMIYVSPTQLNGQLPFPVSGTATMVLHTPSGVSNNFKFDVKPAAPAVFRATLAGLDGQVPTVVRATNNELVTTANPVHLDDWITVYITGLGATSPDVDAGMPGPADPLAEARIKPTVTLGGAPLWVEYAGMAPGQVVYQINARVPFKGVETGMDVPLVISQGDQSTTINVRVVR